MTNDERAKLMAEEIEPVRVGRSYPACPVYFYTDLEHDELRFSNLNETDREAIDKALAAMTEPVVRKLVDMKENPVFSENALALEEWLKG